MQNHLIQAHRYTGTLQGLYICSISTQTTNSQKTKSVTFKLELNVQITLAILHFAYLSPFLHMAGWQVQVTFITFKLQVKYFSCHFFVWNCHIVSSLINESSNAKQKSVQCRVIYLFFRGVVKWLNSCKGHKIIKVLWEFVLYFGTFFSND